jgi:hypothetical protein
MNDTGWNKIVDAIDTKFGLADHGTKTEPLEDRHDLTHTIQFIVFEKDGERYKIERVTGPAIIDRKSIHAKSATSSVRFENVYDPEETMHKTNFYKSQGPDWELISPEDINLA